MSEQYAKYEYVLHHITVSMTKEAYIQKTHNAAHQLQKNYSTYTYLNDLKLHLIK